jgi:hypothetical protein
MASRTTSETLFELDWVILSRTRFSLSLTRNDTTLLRIVLAFLFADLFLGSLACWLWRVCWGEMLSMFLLRFM